MDAGSIVAICLAGISAAGTVLTIGYVGYKTYFGDKQNTTITITSETYYPGGGLAGVKRLNFNSDDNDRYEASSVKFRNGKQEVSASGGKQPINIDAVTAGKDLNVKPTETTYLGTSPAPSPRIVIKRDIGDKDSAQPNHEEIEISDLGLILNNDLQGEKVVSDMRKTNFCQAINAFVIGIKSDYNIVERYLTHNSPQAQEIEVLGESA